MEDVLKLAQDIGFTNSCALDVATLAFLPEVREMCSVNTCGAYGKNWSCPPACGTLEECRARTGRYSTGVIVQTTSQLDDPFDYEGMAALQKKHQGLFVRFAQALRADARDILPLGAGPCLNCESCTYPQEPCRAPDTMFSPMEGYGIFVSDLCAKNGIRYYYGANTLTYVSMVLFAG